MAKHDISHGARKAIWRNYGVWLLLGLEFELASDIIGSVVSPEVAGHRRAGRDRRHSNFLNYVLEKDLDSAEASGEVPRKGE